MGRKSAIAVLMVVVATALVAVGAYVYDNSHRGQIADGVMIEGIAVGGMSAAEAEAAVRRGLLAPLHRAIEVTYEGETWRLADARLKVRADLPQAVDRALAASQDGGLPTRLVRYVSGGEIEESIPAGVEYSHSAINRFVRHVAAEINREPVSAAVEPGAAELHVVAAKAGRKLRDNELTTELELAIRNGAGAARPSSPPSTRPHRR